MTHPARHDTRRRPAEDDFRQAQARDFEQGDRSAEAHTVAIRVDRTHGRCAVRQFLPQVREGELLVTIVLEPSDNGDLREKRNDQKYHDVERLCGEQHWGGETWPDRGRARPRRRPRVAGLAVLSRRRLTRARGLPCRGVAGQRRCGHATLTGPPGRRPAGRLDRSFVVPISVELEQFGAPAVRDEGRADCDECGPQYSQTPAVGASVREAAYGCRDRGSCRGLAGRRNRRRAVGWGWGM